MQIGIDIGSTGAKTIVMDEGRIVKKRVQPTGWSSLETSKAIRSWLEEEGIDVDTFPVVSTGYGRVNVPYADKNLTEITCHALGAVWIFKKEDMTVIDIGGQDTKIIHVVDGAVFDFLMNDKCSAGTGRFLEVMANSLGVDLEALFEMAQKGSGVTISSMCTVFAESEVISLIGAGESRQNIAYAVVHSIVEKVTSQVSRLGTASKKYVLTGGLSGVPYLQKALSEALGHEVLTHPYGRYAGAIGAALSAGKIKKKKET